MRCTGIDYTPLSDIVLSRRHKQPAELSLRPMRGEHADRPWQDDPPAWHVADLHTVNHDLDRVRVPTIGWLGHELHMAVLCTSIRM